VLGLNKSFKQQDIINIKKYAINLRSSEEDIVQFNLSFNTKIILIKIKKNFQGLEIEKIGARVFDFIKKNKINKLQIIEKNINSFSLRNSFFINEFLHGLLLKSYSFDKYKTKTKNNKIFIHIPINLKKKIQTKDLKFNSLLQGTIFTKDLVSEPGNILFPGEYVKRISLLKKYGLNVKIYAENELKKLGMGALLGVGQGSIRQSYLVTVEWNGLNKKQKPLAFVGKGVCFDTGGISLKPAKFMEDMTYDMAGSAVVVGLMKTLALRRAKVNAVGVVGLVENMPDGNAQRPGDIVKSYSGKTIEILNTDAEGRLVLADALSYTEKKFKPKFIVDLATLTGAIIVSLGSEYAGLFSNDDKISDQLSKAGEKVGEKVWRMPLNDNYDKLIDSKKADMQNINYVGGAGSITAAQFLQRFILNKTPWAHLDIAGMAFSKYGGALNSGGATGYGVKLLNQLIEDSYE
jgi:leucyl aminopeptidase